MAPSINIGTIWRRVFIFAPGRLIPEVRTLGSVVQEARWAQKMVWGQLI
jgi:hypothetical protein